ncbi:pro-platelet basic protein [Phyllostomus discolor]|uniref:C-X-C motif chemokine n=1 Tax=Phyllostomus discolor TaxID=89673 RepID=A0A7E6DFU3_9CHIR|nr:platelet basic protein isoform X2 [Phyllostomus discolor]KAF6132203.1 pro-platelet basic protein [Phyllostomus discolor]
MGFRPSTSSSYAHASPLHVLQVLLPLSLLLIALVPSTIGQIMSVDKELYIELRCRCVKTISSIHPSNIQSVNVIKSGPHCNRVEVIAMLKNEKKICLDPEAPRIRKIVQKILEGGGSAA